MDYHDLIDNIYQNIFHNDVISDKYKRYKIYEYFITSSHDISEKQLKLMDELLKYENKTAIKLDLKCLVNLWKGDITTLQVDAIVNAANDKGLGCFNPNHKCIDNIIHQKAGPRLREYCKKKLDKKYLKTGYPMITPGFCLPAKYIFHINGSIWNPQEKNIKYQELSLCYWNILKDAHKYNLKTLAFCCISTGIYGFPKLLFHHHVT